MEEEGGKSYTTADDPDRQTLNLFVHVVMVSSARTDTFTFTLVILTRLCLSAVHVLCFDDSPHSCSLEACCGRLLRSNEWAADANPLTVLRFVPFVYRRRCRFSSSSSTLGESEVRDVCSVCSILTAKPLPCSIVYYASYNYFVGTYNLPLPSKGKCAAGKEHAVSLRNGRAGKEIACSYSRFL